MNEDAGIGSRREHSEDGYTLLVAVFLLALLTLSLAIAIPKVKQDLQRQRELEAMHRGKQYIRAVQLYYRKFHRYPPDINALENTDGIRFLRKEYVDPITGKSDWQTILFGQNKVPTAVGFFGQVVGGTTVAGTGPGGTSGSNGNPGSGGTSSSFGSSSGLNFSSTSNNGAGGNTLFGGSGIGGSSGSNGSFGSNSTSTASGSSSGQTFGGAGVIGVTIPSDKQSILIYKKQEHYNQWEFVYDPLIDSVAMLGGGAAGNPAGSSTGGTAQPTSPSAPVPNSPWGPNGNLPSPSQPPTGTNPVNPWGPNGNLPSASPPQ
jgi:type II secretory pathway pseudopilin PulG